MTTPQIAARLAVEKQARAVLTARHEDNGPVLVRTFATAPAPHLEANARRLAALRADARRCSTLCSLHYHKAMLTDRAGDWEMHKQAAERLAAVWALLHDGEDKGRWVL